MEAAASTESKTSWLHKPVTTIFPGFTVEHLLVTLIILAAIVTRFYAVGLRVMSHDEVNHVVPSYELYQGRGYAHDPITHGPLQFHLVAASYFLMGDSDFASRVPAALFSIATVIFVLFAFRRYLGRTGALLAGLFFLVSPYMLFYGRYTRNEAFVALFGVIMLYAVLRYLETGRHTNLYLFTIVLALHFVTKETSFIYTAQLLIFLAVLFLRDVIKKQWISTSRRNLFVFTVLALLFFIAVALGAAILESGSITNPEAASPIYHTVMLVSLGLALAGLIVAGYELIHALGWHVVKEIRSFDLLILTITIVLPQLIAFPMNLVGFNPLDYSQTGLVRSSLFLLGAVLISLALGVLWKPKLWAINIGIFYAIFTVFYTTFFTNGQGFFTGLVGSLGYWLTQQGVNRGSQPWYFFIFPQLLMYEYLAVVGTILAFIIGVRKRLIFGKPVEESYAQVTPVVEADEVVEPQTANELADTTEDDVTENMMVEREEKIPTLALLLFWSVMSLLAYSLAGEKMPWLTVHITLPMLLCAGFAFGYVLDSLPFKELAGKKTALILLALPVFLVSFGAVISALFGTNPPFAGNELDQLRVTSTFLFALAALVVSAWLLWKWLRDWRTVYILKFFTLGVGVVLLVLTARSAFQASYINYDNAKEFLVYAHSARGPKDVLEQVEEISQRTTGGTQVKVAYIGDALYPYWWYFREYPNKTWLQDDLTRDLLNYPIVIADDAHITKVQAILKDGYFETKYMRLVWPMQDYWNLTWSRLWEGVTNPEMRQAIFDIWLYKDYALYSKVSGNNNLSLESWQPSGSIYLFVKKDIVSQIWTYGALPAQAETAQTDPYEGKYIELIPDKVFGTSGNEEGRLNAVRDIAIAPDDTIYVADSQNHRIQAFSAEGAFIRSWGMYAPVDSGNAPGGTFNEPWGIAVGPDGAVYVADTWNHRIQKFRADGTFITMWGVPGLAEQPNQFWGPRGIAVDAQNRVYVTDTGNNRVVVFDDSGNFLTQFGRNGINPGEFDEPVGIAVGLDGLVFVADTWNQRIQVFQEDGIGGFTYLREWEVNAWFGQSINNKPFLALDAENNVYITDPDGYRVLVFDARGEFLRGWGAPSSGVDGFGIPAGIAVDAEGKVWVTDAENNFALRFTLPALTLNVIETVVDIPAVLAGLTYDAASDMLYNELGMPVYRLGADRLEWLPVVPDGIAAFLPVDAQPTRDDQGEWVLLSAEGSVLFQWDPLTYAWVVVSTTP
jgi:predicted membrane-bound mannosyltransferase/DNA-binding beta-propeller fold protein YncE